MAAATMLRLMPLCGQCERRVRGPRVVTGFVNIVLEFVERLGYDPCQATIGIFAAGFKVLPDERRRGAGLIVRELPRKPSWLRRIPERSVAGPHAEAVWDDRGQPTRENVGQPISVDVHAKILHRGYGQRPPTHLLDNASRVPGCIHSCRSA